MLNDAFVPCIDGGHHASCDVRSRYGADGDAVPRGDYPHDVAAAATGGDVWCAGQKASVGGLLNPTTGQIERIPLGKGAAPQGVIVGPDGRNAIVRVDPTTKEVKVWPLSPERMPYTALNTAAFDGKGRIWLPDRHLRAA
jgi:virginiamycin B lyase